GHDFPILQGAPWASWVVAGGLAVAERRGGRRIASLALVSAIQVGSLAAELIAQTAILIVVLAARGGGSRRWRRLASAALVSALLSAPTLLGARAMVRGTAREAGFAGETTLSWSLRPAELPAIVLPSYFGDMHTFSD